jgi:hypothetical protein
LDALEQLTTTKTRLYFILQLGYFKAKHQFFTFNLDEVNDDVTFLLNHFFHEPHLEMVGCIARNSISLIKQLCFCNFDSTSSFPGFKTTPIGRSINLYKDFASD